MSFIHLAPGPFDPISVLTDLKTCKVLILSYLHPHRLHYFSTRKSLSILFQVVTNRDTQETLLCMACVFEVSNSEHGAQHHIYRLVKEWEALGFPSGPPSFHRLTNLKTSGSASTWKSHLQCFLVMVSGEVSCYKFVLISVCYLTAAVNCGTVVLCLNTGIHI